MVHEFDGLELLPQADAVALYAVIGDVIALRLQPFGEGLVAAEGTSENEAVEFAVHGRRQHCDF